MSTCDVKISSMTFDRDMYPIWNIELYSEINVARNTTHRAKKTTTKNK